METIYRPQRLLTAIIAATASLSDAVDLEGLTPVGLVMPAAWTTANLTFEASADGEAFGRLDDGATGAEVLVFAAAGRRIRLEPNGWLLPRFLKLRSGTAGVPVAQAAARTIGIVAMGLGRR